MRGIESMTANAVRKFTFGHTKWHLSLEDSIIFNSKQGSEISISWTMYDLPKPSKNTCFGKFEALGFQVLVEQLFRHKGFQVIIEQLFRHKGSQVIIPSVLKLPKSGVFWRFWWAGGPEGGRYFNLRPKNRFQAKKTVMEDRRLGSSNCYFSSKLPMKCASVFNFLSEESFLFEHFVSKNRYHGSCFYPRVCQNEVRVSIRGKYFEHIQIWTGPDLVHFGSYSGHLISAIWAPFRLPGSFWVMLWPPHIRHLGPFSAPWFILGHALATSYPPFGIVPKTHHLERRLHIWRFAGL